MKRWLILALTLPLVGCGVEILTTTAIQGEMASQNAAQATRVLDRVKESAALQEVEQAIRAYKAETGKYPASLQTLVPQYLARVPMDPQGRPYGYDPATGAVFETAQPSQTQRITETDKQNLQQIYNAIYAYWQATRRYPPSLNALVPDYLSSVPVTSSGQQFVYNARTGAINHPLELVRQQRQTQPQARRGGGTAGVGPLGDTLTGISVQNELNRQGNNSAGQTRAREGAQSIGDEHTRRQTRAFDEFDIP